MTTPDDAPLLRHAPATVHGRYLVRPAGTGLWLVGFHGQGQTAAAFHPALAASAPGNWLVAAVQGLNRYYAGRSQDVVANWMTREDREFAIADNVAWVDGVLDRLAGEFGPPRVLVLAGFSQGVAMAYRAARLGRHACAAVVVVGGDVPPELTREGGAPWPRVLAMTGAADGWYGPDRLAADGAFLRAARADARVEVFDGGHEWGEPVAARVRDLLAELAGEAGA